MTALGDWGWCVVRQSAPVVGARWGFPASRTTIGRKPRRWLPLPWHAPGRGHTGDDDRVDPVDGEELLQIRAWERARPLLGDDQRAGLGAIRLSISTSGLPAASVSRDLVNPQPHVGRFAPSVTSAVVLRLTGTVLRRTAWFSCWHAGMTTSS
jgi:hypothetical protein